MTPGEFERLDELFQRVSALAGEARAEALDRETAGDPALRAAIDGLLDADARAGGFLEEPPLRFESSRLGPWRIVKEIARGGMGMVYLGERADGRYEQRVAVKITTSAIATETHLLARLEHPHIARLLDAGSTGAGFPYLVMEFVEGLPLDQWIETRQPGREERLRLFLQICAAVQYAHQNLILHRDLKPANILVTPRGEPKLLDFGIARSLDQETGASATRTPAFTPEYASPEQLRGAPLTTASDVFALGALLHTMLAGAPPRVFGGLTFDEIYRRATAGEAGSPGVEGDEGQIIRKAVRGDPRARYVSAAELAADVRRRLEGRPVIARPPSLGYRASRFLARNKWRALLAAVVVAALVSAAVMALLQARAAERRFNQVRRLARSVLFELHDGIAPLAGSMPVRRVLAERALEYIEALAAEAGRDPSLTREVAEGYLRLAEVQGAPGIRNLGLYEAAGQSYRKAYALARRLADRGAADLDAWRLLLRAERAVLQAELSGAGRREALAKIERHLSAARDVERRFANAVEARRLVAEAHLLRAMGYEYNALPRALDEQALALRLFAQLPAPGYLDRRRLSGLHQTLSDAYLRRKDRARAYQHVRAAIAGQEETARLFPRSYSARFDLTLGAQQLASLFSQDGRNREATVLLERVVETRAKLLAEEPEDVVARAWLAQGYSMLGLSRSRAGPLAAAVEPLRRGVDLYRSLLAVEKNSQRFQKAVADSEAALADVYWRLEQRREACALYGQAHERYLAISRTALQASVEAETPRAAAHARERCRKAASSAP